ncbi:hypothetical protein ACE1SV_09950 [Streptomyces sennicomposti]
MRGSPCAAAWPGALRGDTGTGRRAVLRRRRRAVARPGPAGGRPGPFGARARARSSPRQSGPDPEAAVRCRAVVQRAAGGGGPFGEATRPVLAGRVPFRHGHEVRAGAGLLVPAPVPFVVADDVKPEWDGPRPRCPFAASVGAARPLRWWA